MEFVTTQLASITALPLWYPFHSHYWLTKTQFLLNTKFMTSTKMFYRGIASAAFFQPLFPLAIMLKRLLIDYIKQNNSYSNVVDWILTFLIGMSTAIISNPLDVLISKRKHAETTLAVIKNTPMRNFYKGFMISSTQNGIFFLALTSMYSYFAKLFQNNFLGAVASSFLSSLIIVPLDSFVVMKQNNKYNNCGIGHCIRTVYKEKGFGGLFSGFLSKWVAATNEIFFFHYFKNFYDAKLLGI